MKFEKGGQRILAMALSAGLAFGLTSCSASNTIDYLYLLSSKNNPGQVNVYRVDSQTGVLTQIPNSPYPAGRNPVGIVIAPNGKTLYVINHDDNTIESIGIGTDAKLYPQHTYTTPGSEPVALSINAAGTLLFVVDHYQPPYTDLNPGPGAIIVYPINASGALSSSDTASDSTGDPVPQTLPNGNSANYYALQTSPSAVTVLPNGNTAYVTEQLTAGISGCNTGQGDLEALSVSSAGVLSAVAGSPYCAGLTPSAITSHPNGNYLYVTDSTQNGILGYTVAGTGALSPFSTGLIGAGTAPAGLTIESRGIHMYVANRTSGNVQGYLIDASTGALSSIGTASTGTYPQCVVVEPRESRFVYTADFNGVGSTGFKLDPTTGELTSTENSPYGGTGLSTCLAATPHGGTS